MRFKGCFTLLSLKDPNQHHVWCYVRVQNLNQEAVSSGSLFCLVNDISVFLQTSYQRLILRVNVQEYESWEPQQRCFSTNEQTELWAQDVALQKITRSFRKPDQTLRIDVLKTKSLSGPGNLKTAVHAKVTGLSKGLKRQETALASQLFLQISKVMTPLKKYLQTEGDLLTRFIPASTKWSTQKQQPSPVLDPVHSESNHRRQQQKLYFLTCV